MIDSEVFPRLVRVTFWDALGVPTAWLPKVRLVVERLATGAIATPDPVRVMVCEPPEALSLTVTVPLSVPSTVGRKVTAMLQLPPGATEAPHVFVCE